MKILIVLSLLLSVVSIVFIGLLWKQLMKSPVKKQGTMFKDDWVFVETTEHTFTKEIVQTRHYFTFYEVAIKPRMLLAHLSKCVGCSSMGSVYTFNPTGPCPNCGCNVKVERVGRIKYTDENLPNWEIVDCSKKEE